MRQALRIFRKDVHHLWPLIALVLAVKAVELWMMRTVPKEEGLLWTLAWTDLLATICLIVAVVHQESMVGDRRYWLTRPFHPAMLASAKALFLMAFVCLPRGLMAVSGGFAHVAPQIFFLAAEVILPVAALAAVTQGFVQFTWAALASAVGYWAVAIGVMILRMTQPEGWGGVEWMRTWTVAAFLLASSAAVLFVQYTRGNPRVAWWMLAAALSICACWRQMPGWHAAFTLQSRLSGRTVATDVARVRFDDARVRQVSRPRLAKNTWQRMLDVAVPVKVEGIPPGMLLYGEGSQVTIEAANGSRWNSGWDSITGLISWKDRVSSRELPGEGEAWFWTVVDPEFYGHHDLEPVHMHAKLALTLLSEEEVSRLEMREGAQLVQRDGRCRLALRHGTLLADCWWPARTPARMEFRYYRDDGTRVVFSPRSGSYGPVATPAYWPWTHGQPAMPWVAVPRPPARLELVTRWPVAHFEREIDIPNTGEWFKP
jgi:hypothetical protein